MRGWKLALAGFVAVLVLGMTVPARANVVFSGTGTNTNGTAISATADFSLIGNVLQIVLTNNDVSIAQASVLTNLAVTTAPPPASTLPSPDGTIALTTGSSLVSGTAVDTTDSIGSEWAYLTGGLASSGFGVGTGAGNLCGTTTCTGAKLGGSAFGLVGTGSDLSLKGLKPANTYIENSVTVDIVLASNSTWSLADITSVTFQYGTSPGEGSITVDGCTAGSDCNSTPVPEPGSLALLGIALAGLGLVLHRRRRA